MAGKFMRRAAIIDSVKSEHATNARRRREGLTRHPVRGYACGCPAPSCGAFYVIDTTKVIPTAAECRALLAADNRGRKSNTRGRRR
jgi:hypothetical protein